jgi:peptidoglycan-associated lipoprotein
MVQRAVRVALVLALVVLGGVGCSSKKPDSDLGSDESGKGLSEESVGSGSLDQARAGLLGGQAGTGPLVDIQFGYDSFELSDEARQTLQGHSSWLRNNQQGRVEIEGHCDDRGTVEYNLALGAKRASMAKSYLVSLGVSADRITTISYGEELPLCYEASESCYSRNRRAHFVVIAE